MKLKKIKIKNYKILQDFDIDFLDSSDNILDTIVIAGINGSGKTTLLEFIDNFYKVNLLDNDFIAFENISLNSHSNGLAGVGIKKDIKIIYLKVFDNQLKIIVSQIKNFIDMIKDNNEDLTIKEANQKAVDEINSIFDGLDLKVQFKGISKDIKREILFQNSIKDDIKLDELSTGEQQLFIRAMNLKMMEIKDSIVLIDEPEISLHPNW
ncbi:MAG: AAA family ATPase [Campylobacterota bacterium]|nr:AAA family ATPase [Campylobacterota bacterium]